MQVNAKRDAPKRQPNTTKAGPGRRHVRMSATITLPQPLAAALTPAIEAGAIIDRCTVWPWIVDVCWSRTEGIGNRTIDVVQAPMSKPPQAEDHIPADAQLLRAEVFPATRFDDMTPHVRVVYRSQYSAYLMWRKAHALGKTVADLVPWTDYDPVMVDETIQRWINPGVVRYCGD